jgi:ribosome-associated protein YbcJ (S4-like RNA binding protein)
MDDLVKQAMAKWPNVPACYGWLGLDGRGDWYMRDDQTQAAGSFETNKGSRLQHQKLIEFIGRNYEI